MYNSPPIPVYSYVCAYFPTPSLCDMKPLPNAWHSNLPTKYVNVVVCEKIIRTDLSNMRRTKSFARW